MTPRLLALFAMLACSADPLAPVGAARVDLGPRFTAAWQAVQGCSGLSGRSEAVAVFSVPGDHIMLDGRKIVAYWTSSSNSIYVASFYLTSDPVLRHEILHALLHRGDHPPAYFIEKCGALVGAGE